MLVAALLAMTLAASAPAFAQQTSGPATGLQAVNAAHAGNVCVQQLQNVNTGNVDQDQAAANINEQIGAIQVAIDSAAVQEANVAQAQDVNQSITQTQDGIHQTNNALQICNQVLNR